MQHLFYASLIARKIHHLHYVTEFDHVGGDIHRGTSVTGNV